jgi:hypothetical protein
MRQIILILFLLFFKCSYGQNLTPDELIKYSKVTKELFDSYMTEKGYKLNKAKDTEGLYASYLYTNNKIVRFCSHREYDNKNILISYQTYNTSDYKSAKQRIKQLGFTLFKTKTLEDGALVFHFKKNNDVFALTSWVENATNIYEIAFKNNYFQKD